MDTVREWSAGMCIAAIISAVTTMLIPSGNLEKSVKAVLSVFLICSMILPFVGSNPALKLYSFKNFDIYDNSENSISEEVVRQTEDSLRNSIVDVLKKNGISCGGVNINTELNNGELKITAITVISPSSDEKTVKDLLRSELSIEVQTE